MRHVIAGSLIVGLLAMALYAGQPQRTAVRTGGGGDTPAAIGSPRLHRLVWQSAENMAQFADKGEDCWVELDKDGKVFLQFKEVRRNCDFVELFDDTRGYVLRLYDDALFIQGGREGFARFQDFTQYYGGRWVK